MEVEIRMRGRFVRAGVVDAVMPDATVLWLAPDHNGNRTLFESAEGYEVWIDPHDLSGEGQTRPPALVAEDHGGDLE